MTSPIPTCPTCSGPQMQNHPGGFLEFDHHDPCALRDAEDATRAADYERANVYTSYAAFTRPTTPTELTLAAQLGPIPQDVITHVSYLTRGLRARTLIRRKDLP